MVSFFLKVYQRVLHAESVNISVWRVCLNYCLTLRTFVTLIEGRLRIITVSAHLQQFVGTDIFVKARGIGVVVSGTWFLFRWKQQLTDDLIAKHKIDEVITLTIHLFLHETFSGDTKIYSPSNVSLNLSHKY